MNFYRPDFPRHAFAYKGGKKGASSGGAAAAPAPRTYGPDDSVTYENAADYFKTKGYKGGDAAFTDPWNESFNQWTAGLERDYGVGSYQELKYGQLAGKANDLDTRLVEQENTFNTAINEQLQNYQNTVAQQQQQFTQATTQQQQNYEASLLAQQTRNDQAMAAQQTGNASLLASIREQMAAYTAANTPSNANRDEEDGGNQVTIIERAAPPPASDRVQETKQAGREAKRAARRRKGFFSTQGAGETGGYQGQVRSLLGQPQVKV